MTFSAHHWPQCAKVPFSQNMQVYARQKVTTFKAHKESLNFFPKGVGVGGKLLSVNTAESLVPLLCQLPGLTPIVFPPWKHIQKRRILAASINLSCWLVFSG